MLDQSQVEGEASYNHNYRAGLDIELAKGLGSLATSSTDWTVGGMRMHAHTQMYVYVYVYVYIHVYVYVYVHTTYVCACVLDN